MKFLNYLMIILITSKKQTVFDVQKNKLKKQNAMKQQPFFSNVFFIYFQSILTLNFYTVYKK